MTIHDDLQSYRKSVRWFLDINYPDHVNNSHDERLYSPLLSHHHAGDAPATIMGTGLAREFVPARATIDRLSLALLMSSQATAADRLRQQARALEVSLVDWQDECHAAVEQWRWDKSTIGDVPQDLPSVIGSELCHRLENVRTRAIEMLLILDGIAAEIPSHDPPAAQQAAPAAPRKPRDDAPSDALKEKAIELFKQHKWHEVRRILHDRHKSLLPDNKRANSDYPTNSIMRKWKREAE